MSANHAESGHAQMDPLAASSNTSCGRVFTNDAIGNIQVDLGEAGTAEEFLAKVGERAADPGQTLPSTFSIQLARPLGTHTNESANAIAIYEALPDLDPVNASDPRLWDYLAFTMCRTYMERRWPIESGKNWRGRVKDRWFFLHPSRGVLIRHGIARLWWIASLTYDQDCSHRLSSQNGDRYAYTRWVLENEDRVISIFDRRLGSDPNLRFALLDAMQDSTRKSNSAAIRDAARQVRLQQSYRQFNAIRQDELEKTVPVIIHDSITEKRESVPKPKRMQARPQ